MKSGQMLLTQNCHNSNLKAKAKKIMVGAFNWVDYYLVTKT